MKLGEWKPVTKVPPGRQDTCATATQLVTTVPRSGRSKLHAWAKLDAAPRLVCELAGFVARLHPVPGTDSVIARVLPSWPFVPDGTPLGMYFDDADPPAVFEQKRAALSTLGDDTVLVIVDTETGVQRELARSDAMFRIGDVVVAPDGVALAISGNRPADGQPGGYAWSTRIVDGTKHTVVAEHAVDGEALCPHTWNASGLVLYSRVYRGPSVPRDLFHLVDGAVARTVPEGLVSPDGAYRVRLEGGALTVTERDHAPRVVPADTGLAKRVLTKLGTLPSGLLIEGGAWWWGPRHLVLGDADPQVLDLATCSLSRLMQRESDVPPIGDGGGRWLVADFGKQLHWTAAG